MKKKTKVVATPKQIAAAFTEWMRRWHESEGATRKAMVAALNDDPKTYGEEVAPYFIELLGELAAAQAA